MPSVTYAADGRVHTKTFVYDAAPNAPISNLTLIGSWDKNTGRYSTQWNQSAIRMHKDDKGRWTATVPLMDDADHPWQWGVLADAPTGKQQWAIFDEGNLDFSVESPKKEVYAPTTSQSMGVHQDGTDATFKYWAPNAQNVSVALWHGSDKPTLVPMQKDAATGMWSSRVPQGWQTWKGANYAYQVKTSDGDTILHDDPYGLLRQGPQLGISDLYLHPVTGQEVNQYYVDPTLQKQNKPSWVRFERFEVQGHPQASDVSLVLRDENGKVLGKDALLARLGQADGSLVGKLHNGKFNDFWQQNVDDQGRIHLTRQGDAWATALNNSKALAGLHYDFEITENGKTKTLKDPYSDVIDANIGWSRYNVVGDAHFDWKNDNAPRMAPDRKNWIIYEMHVGSFFGQAQNVQRSTFKDVMDKLQYLKDMGINTIELMPTDPFQGLRDWGYMGTESMGVAGQYGFMDDDGHWVNGREALCRFIDTAHGMGFNVLNDVVYNHWGGDPNDMWNSDGSKNPYFNWDPNAAQPVVKQGMDGSLPALNNPAVRQFIIDSASSNVDDLHFDGSRFDFTHPIHDQGAGGTDGWTLLRRINRQLHFFHPGVETNAEEFPNREIITQPAQPNLQGGAGFDTMWNTEFNHRLVHGSGDPSVLEQAVAGQQTNMDREMGEITNPPGFSSPNNAITIITDHDEVGNGAPIINVADNYQQGGVPNEWQRNATRTCFGIGMLSPGTPLFFQGAESNSRDTFSWGIPSSWDMGWDWLHVGDDWSWKDATFDDASRAKLAAIADTPGAPDEAKLTPTQKQIVQYLRDAGKDNRDKAEWDVYRKMQHNFTTDVIALRKSSPAFDGDADVSRVYTHNDNSVMAFTRQKGNDQYLVIASLNKKDQPGYNIPLDGGQWQLVFNSDATQYGGDGFGSVTSTAGDAKTMFDIPKGGLLVYKRVG